MPSTENNTFTFILQVFGEKHLILGISPLSPSHFWVPWLRPPSSVIILSLKYHTDVNETKTSQSQSLKVV